MDARAFIGRARECEALIAELLGGSRLLTIVGPSGMGKTRLARQVKALLGEQDHPLGRGPRFCSLIDCETSTDVEEVVARVMGLPDEPGAQLSREGAASAPLLLVLDNVDHLRPEAAAVAAHLCDHLEGLQILVTSIAPLEVEWEVCFELGPLEQGDAQALYRDRSRRAGRLPAVEDEEVIEALVGRLDRIPLAIELAAARVRELPPRLLLERIGARFELLQSGRAGRHGSLKAALSLSWDLLLPRERELLSKASVFVGGFTLESARAILGSSPVSKDGEGKGRRRQVAHQPTPAEASEAGEPLDLELLTLVDGLMSKALLQRDGSEVPRFTFYESVRDYAAQALRDAGEEAEALARHAASFRERGLHHEALRIDGGERRQASVRWLNSERENLLAAHRRTFRSEPAAAAELGLAVVGVQQMQGATAAELELFDSVVDAARRSGDAALLVRALGSRVPALMRHARISRCREDLKEALELCRSLKDRRQEVQLRSSLGVVLAKLGELNQAREQMAEAMRIALELKTPLLEAVVHLGASLIAVNGGDVDGAAAESEQALAIARSEGSLSMEARALANLGMAIALKASFREARRLLQDALAIAKATNHRGSVVYLLMMAGGFEVMAGELEVAERHLSEALELEETKGNRRYVAFGISNLGLIAFERGDLRQAQQRQSQAVGLFEEAGDRVERANCLLYLAAASALRGKLQEARKLQAEARAFFERVGDSLGLEGADLLDGFLDIGEARHAAIARDWARSPQLEARARSLLEHGPSGQATMARATRILRRLLERALSEPPEASSILAEELVIARDGAWFEFEGEERVNLETRESLRKMLLELVHQRHLAPGVPLSSEKLFTAAWSQRINPDSARRRVYTGIWTLRAFGLSTAIVHDGEGYLLDPLISVVFAG